MSLSVGAHLAFDLDVFFIARLLPLSSSFPYTTLFRSHLLRRHARRAVRRPPRTLRDDAARGRVRPAVRLAGRARQARDRKSTRLNSSHMSISYAVFCLKKKSMTIDVLPRTPGTNGNDG